MDDQGANRTGRRVLDACCMATFIIALLSVVSGIVGCETRQAKTSAANGPISNNNLIVPGERIGKYVINASTLAEILGTDSPESRNRLANEGFFFEFNQGRNLTGVIADTDHFQMANGLKVGSTSKEVEAIMGEPKARTINGEKIELDALVYVGVIFILKDETVGAIRVGQPDNQVK